jgi:biotin transporter BioY
MRFEVIAAFVIGVMLPVLETGRRGISTWAVNFTTMFEDYLAGALLLVAGWAAYRSKSWGAVFLVLAWAYFAGLMTSSFVGQLEETLRQTASEPGNSLVLVVKFLLWSVCVTSLVLSFRTVHKRQFSHG